MKESLRTKRFQAYCIAMGVLLLVAMACVYRGVGVEVAIMAIATVSTGYLGFGAWHDKGVRTEMLKGPTNG